MMTLLPSFNASPVPTLRLQTPYKTSQTSWSQGLKESAPLCQLHSGRRSWYLTGIYETQLLFAGKTRRTISLLGDELGAEEKRSLGTEYLLTKTEFTEKVDAQNNSKKKEENKNFDTGEKMPCWGM